MKTKISLLAILVSLTLGACKKNEGNATVSYTVSVEYPNSYKDRLVAGATVMLTNTFTGSSQTASTNAEGQASFDGLLPGTYQITAQKDLSADESLEQTGLEGEIYLNAAVNNHGINSAGTYSLQLKGSPIGGWVLKEIYYTGAPGSAYFFNDQFFELYNNSADTLYADSLCMGDAVGSPYVSSSSRPSGFLSDTEHVYFQNIFMVPGNGSSHPVAPGKSFLISRSAINHKSDSELGNPNSPVDLGTGISDFEVYWETAGRDTDNPDVPNMQIIHFGTATAFDWVPSVFGPSIVIFKHADPANLPQELEPGGSATRTYPKVPVENVIDGVDCIRNASVSHFKRLPVSVDAGFQHATNSYTGESIRRKVKTEVNGRKVLHDTNNSTNDFELLSTPTPKGW